MKFGVMNLFPAEGDGDDAQVLRDTIEEIQIADELGFDSCWLAEHHFSRYGILGNPLMLGTAIAERTRNITIGTAVVVVPLHDPLRIAEDAALLDILSGGRLVLGIGRGYQPNEFRGFGKDRNANKELYAEIVDILKLAWTQENWSYEGKHFQYGDMNIFPKPVTPGGPPILHGTSSPETFRQRGLAGDHIIVSSSFTPMQRIKDNYDSYREALVEGGHESSGFDLPFMQQVWVGGSADGLQAAAGAALNYYRSVGKVIPGSDEAIESERVYYDKVQRNIGLLTVEKTLTHGGTFGSVDRVVDTLGRIRDELGVTHYIGWFHIPSLDRKRAIESMETFAAKVIPQLTSV
ncbi:LLM class flavin-dependent oxidoreductase [Streptosporangium sp. NPDC049644]|uniref:LLM class flavin-dependent oxidoreductase n=1 Tax=Streptosporangium sp. NPDC049644 TaxID=3155507 RepID=UPI00341B0954